MWIILAFGSALFAGITAILAKIGIKNTDSNVATAIRTIVILLFSWIIVFLVGSQKSIPNINMESLTFLILSGFATGGSWLCYFKALQLGNVNKVAPIDKSSTILSMLLAFIILRENVTLFNFVAMFAIGIGTYLMIRRKDDVAKSAAGYKWFVYALFSAIFASLTSILGKIGIQGVESNLGTAIRTIVVLIMAWMIVFVSHKQNEITKIDRKSMIFIYFSGISTGLSWLCYYKALQLGPASIVVPIDKLSILVTIAFSYLFLKEKVTKKYFFGLCLMVIGTLLLLV